MRITSKIVKCTFKHLMCLVLLLIASRAPRCGQLGRILTKAAQSFFQLEVGDSPGATPFGEESPAESETFGGAETPKTETQTTKDDTLDEQEVVETKSHAEGLAEPEKEAEIDLEQGQEREKEGTVHLEQETEVKLEQETEVKPEEEKEVKLEQETEVEVEEKAEVEVEEEAEPEEDQAASEVVSEEKHLDREEERDDIVPFGVEDAVSALNTIQSIWRYASEPGVDFTRNDIFSSDIVLPSDLAWKPGIEFTKGFVSKTPLLTDGHWTYASQDLFTRDQFLFNLRLFNNKPYMIHGVRFGPTPANACAPKTIAIGVINEQKHVYFSFNRTITNGSPHPQVFELPGHLPGNQLSIRVLSNHGDPSKVCLYPVEIYGQLDL